MADDFEKHGKDVIEKVRETKPEAYLRAIADLVPKDFNLHVDTVSPVAMLLAEVDGKTRGIPSQQK